MQIVNISPPLVANCIKHIANRRGSKTYHWTVCRLFEQVFPSNNELEALPTDRLTVDTQFACSRPNCQRTFFTEKKYHLVKKKTKSYIYRKLYLILYFLRPVNLYTRIYYNNTNFVTLRFDLKLYTHYHFSLRSIKYDEIRLVRVFLLLCTWEKTSNLFITDNNFARNASVQPARSLICVCTRQRA